MIRLSLWWAPLALAMLFVSPTTVRADEPSAKNDPDSLRAEAFEAAQWAVSSDAADALSKMSARFASGSDDIAKLAQRREALITRRTSLERQIEQLYGATAGSDAQRAQLRQDYDQAGKDLANEDKEIAAKFPAYAELTNPQAVPLKEAQALLKPNEGILFVLVNPEATYVWAVSRDRADWARADDLGEKPLTDAVAVLRIGLTFSAASGNDGPDPSGQPAQFDSKLAYHLYDRLLRPVESVFNGKTTLFVVTTGPLSSLPLAVLRTAPPNASTDDARVTDGRQNWLIDRYALATLPTVSSLKTLRCYLAPNSAEVSSGCPPSMPRRSKSASGVARPPLVGFGAPALDERVLKATQRDGNVAAAALFTGRLANRAALMSMGELPEARRELEALKGLVPDSTIRVGAEATETAIKVTDGPLVSNAKYLIFSTHGVLGGTMVAPDGSMSFAEPGLVLTPPAEPSILDDGYLSSSEVAQLQLSADLVVLSACNTASSDGRPSAEGLSGLARSFFYAGAKGVLVSHWSVDDKATMELMVQTFDALKHDPAAGRAVALQHAMLHVRDEGFAHPYYWAAFMLVGEP